jgi:hypothetical protein
MMRAAGRTVLVALSLLAWAATADAECAWVRWFNTDERWSVMEASQAWSRVMPPSRQPSAGYRHEKLSARRAFRPTYVAGNWKETLASPTPSTRVGRRRGESCR